MPPVDYARMTKEWNAVSDYRALVKTGSKQTLSKFAAERGLDYTRLVPKHSAAIKIKDAEEQVKYCIARAAEARDKIKPLQPPPPPEAFRTPPNLPPPPPPPAHLPVPKLTLPVPSVPNPLQEENTKLKLKVLELELNMKQLQMLKSNKPVGKINDCCGANSINNEVVECDMCDKKLCSVCGHSYDLKQTGHEMLCDTHHIEFIAAQGDDVTTVSSDSAPADAWLAQEDAAAAAVNEFEIDNSDGSQDCKCGKGVPFESDVMINGVVCCWACDEILCGSCIDENMSHTLGETVCGSKKCWQHLAV